MSSLVRSSDFLSMVQPEMQQVETLMRSQAEDRHTELEAALTHLLASGGKRVRPAITLLMGELLGAERERLITLAASIELLHTATLVHDDLIDGAILRRGMATLNSQWSPAATVLTGDFIFARAAMLAAETNSGAVIRMFAETLSTIVTGEITQLFAGRGVTSREEYQQRIYAKTASLFELAATSAALISPVGEEQVEIARRFGRSIGMAFQIMDDVLDFTGEQATIGKPVASDLRQGLITLPAMYYLESVPDDPDMQHVIQNGYVGDPLINRLLISIRSSGAIDRSIEDARVYVERGLEDLSRLPDGQQRQALASLAQYFVQREL